MTTLTLSVSEKLAQEVEAFGDWLPVMLEISLLKLKTPTAETASEILEFLASNPDEKDVLNYKVSKRAQARVSKLLELNQAAIISEQELKELDEHIELENIMISLKADLDKNDANA